MKTMDQVQQQIIETIQPALDDLAKRISEQWEEGWVLYQEVLSEYKNHPLYTKRVECTTKDYEDTKRIYSKILSGEWRSASGRNEEDEKAYAQKRLEDNEEKFPRIIEGHKSAAIRELFLEKAGFNKDAAYNDKKAQSKNKDIVKSNKVSAYFHCKSRQLFEAKRDQSIFLAIEQSIFKLKTQIEKKLKGLEIETCEKVEFRFSPDGYVGSWLMNGSQMFTTQCILAGGYNIQQLHIRYIAHLKKPNKGG